MTLRVALEPVDTHEEYRAAVQDGGGVVVGLEEADAVVLCEASHPLPPLPETVRWVQLPAAGIERWLPIMRPETVFTSAAGAFALPVAEHALTLMLVAARNIHAFARERAWIDPPVHSLEGANVTIVGAGGIGRCLIELLRPFSVTVDAVNRSGTAVPGARATVPVGRIAEVLPGADFVVLAAPVTAETVGLLDRERLALLRPTAWVVNVGRGRLIETDALVDALENEQLGGAALDVTDPEPLPPEHPLWRIDRAVITSHVASTLATELPHLARRIRENVSRFAAGRELLGVVDRDAGY